MVAIQFRNHSLEYLFSTRIIRIDINIGVCSRMGQSIQLLLVELSGYITVQPG